MKQIKIILLIMMMLFTSLNMHVIADEIKSYEIVFVIEYDDATGYFPLIANEGDPFNFVPEVPLRKNKEFIGWFVDGVKVELPQTVTCSANYIATYKNVNKSELRATIKQAEARLNNPQVYKKSTVENLRKTLEKVNEIYGDDYATQKAVDEANHLLQIAIDGLIDVIAYFDVDETHWFFYVVEEATALGLMKNTGTGPDLFEPNANITRGMVATVLYRMNGLPNITYVGKFSDVTQGLWYTNAIEWAANKGVVSGYNDGRFGPDNFITRQDLAIMLRNYANKAGLDTNANANFNGFRDGKNVDRYAQSAIAWCVEAGLMSGAIKADGKYLNPKAYATRAECAKMFVLLNAKVNKK